jgi:uncharacterized membrane protein
MTLRRAYLIIVLSFVWLIGAGILGGLMLAPNDPHHLADIVFPIVIGGFLIGILAGFGVWAGAKGYSPLLGIVLAWLGPLGMLVLVFLADRSNKSA